MSVMVLHGLVAQLDSEREVTYEPVLVVSLSLWVEVSAGTFIV